MSETTPTRQGLWFPKDVFLSTNGIRDWDIPRNGLVALYDPYRDAYGLDEAGRAALQTGVDYSGNGNTLTYGSTAGTDANDPSNTGLAFVYDGVDDAFTNTPSGTVYSYVLAGDAYGIGAGWVRGKRVNVAGRVYLALFYNRRLTEAEYASLWLIGRQYLAQRGFAGTVYNEAWPIPCTAGVMDFGLTDSPGHLWVLPDGTTSTVARPAPTLASAGTTWLYCADWSDADLQVNDNNTDSRYVGDLRDLPRVTYRLSLYNCSNVTGSLADAPRVSYRLELGNCSKVTGSLADCPRVSSWLDLGNCTNVTGSLADCPRVSYLLNLYNCSNVTGTLDGTWAANTMNLKGIGWSTSECDQTLINFANGTLTNKSLTISAGKRSSASDAAVATLISRGWTVTES